MPEKISVAKQDLPVEPLDRISPSQYSWLRECSLRGVLSKSSFSLLPVSPKARIGTVAHKVMEEVSNGKLDPREEEHFRERWESLITEKEREMSSSWLNHRFVPLSRSVPELEVIFYQTLNRAKGLWGKKEESIGTGTAQAEKWVESSDGSVGGFIDRVIGTGERVILLDYKSGSLYSSPSDEGGRRGLKDRYKVQVKLYAALYHEMEDTWPEELKLVALNGATEQVEHTKEECRELLEEASQLLDRINQQVLEVRNSDLNPDVLADPSPETCAFCDFRPVCRAYWEERPEGGDAESWPCDLTGNVTTWEAGPNGEIILRLLPSFGKTEKVVHGIEPEVIHGNGTSALTENSEVQLYNLYRQSDEVFQGTSYTAVYSH